MSQLPNNEIKDLRVFAVQEAIKFAATRTNKELDIKELDALYKQILEFLTKEQDGK